MESISKYILVAIFIYVGLTSCSKVDNNEIPQPERRYNNNHEYVDLGLSIKWATCNIGAHKSWEYGDYYAWGETEVKNDYSNKTYKWYDDSISTFTKYYNYRRNSINHELVSDNKIILDLEDDVAHVKWGSNWRMPTQDEFNELINNCNWTWTTQEGVNGYMVTSKKAGYTNHSIFLPAAGAYNGMNIDLVGQLGIYWSSSLDVESYKNAIRLHLSSGNLGWYYRTITVYRYIGLSIRPVCP